MLNRFQSIINFNLIAIALIAYFGVLNKAMAQGWTSSGGGSGVICFKEPSWAKKADLFIDQNRPLTVEVLDAIKTVEALDLFEADPETKKLILEIQNSVAVITGHSDADWLKTYSTIADQIENLSPLFRTSLKRLEDRLPFSKWKKFEYLDLLQDQYATADPRNDQLKKQIAEHYPECRLIQLVLRKSSYSELQRKTKFNFTYPLPSQFFDFEIYYVNSLFEKMDSLNKSVIYLHEQLYLIGGSIGHLNSSDIRYWVREFLLLNRKNISANEDQLFLPANDERFDRGCHETDVKHCFKPPRYLRMRLTQSFGDYVLYFIKDTQASGRSLSEKQNFFFTNFVDELIKYRKFISQCTHQGQMMILKSSCSQTYLNQLFTDTKINRKSSDLLHLVHLAWHYYDVKMGLINYEYLVIPNSESNLEIQRLDLLNYLCALIKKDSEDVRESGETLNGAWIKARQFCLKNY